MSVVNGYNNSSRAHICQCLSRLYTLQRRCRVNVTSGGWKTGKLFVERVLSLAAGLRELGLTAGHVVAISAFNSDSYLEWILAVSCIGGIVAPLNYRWVWAHHPPSSKCQILMCGSLPICSSQIDFS